MVIVCLYSCVGMRRNSFSISYSMGNLDFLQKDFIPLNIGANFSWYFDVKYLKCRNKAEVCQKIT